MNTKPLLIAGAVTAVILAGYAMTMPQSANQSVPDAPAPVIAEEPAPVETTPDMTATEMTAPATTEESTEPMQETATMAVDAEGETTAFQSPIMTYTTQEECQSATARECHEIKCEGLGEGQTVADVCGPEFAEGWQAIVPTPNNTAIPEIVAPPMEMEITPEPTPEPTATP